MIRFVSGDLFAADCDAIANTVNCVGAMGRGIALGVKTRWPHVYDDYRRDCGIGRDCAGLIDQRIGPRREQLAPQCCHPGATCRVHRVRPGAIIARETGGHRIRFILEFPTKRHWNATSRLDDVVAGLQPLAETIARLELTSVALPPLGCSNGGLEWPVVRPLIVSALRNLTTVAINIYGPAT